MPRVKRGVTARARHKKVLEQAKGYRGRRKNVYRIAKEAVMNRRLEQGVDRHRPQGPRRSRRARQGRVYEDRGAGESFQRLSRAIEPRGRRETPPFFV